MMSVGLGGLYWNRTLPGFWIEKVPSVRLPSGPICTKFPTIVCTLDRYMLIRSSSARCLSSKAVAWSELPDLPNGRENGKKLGVFCASAGALSFVAGGEPVLGSGAGVGSGTLSAKTLAVPRQPKANPHTTATIVLAGPNLAAPLPAISLSADTSAYAPNALQEDFYKKTPARSLFLLFAAYGEFAASGVKTRHAILNRHHRRDLQPEFHACRRDWAARRCLPAPCAPSARRRGCNRFAAGAECNWWRPCGRG